MHANNFHLIRFLAAVLVIFGHSYPLAGYDKPDYIQELTGGLLPAAHIGVCIFFSLSGYLIAKSLAASNNYFHFFIKRLVRILPGLIVAILFTAFVIGPLATTLSLSAYFTNHETYEYLKAVKMYPQYSDSLPGVFKKLPIKLVNGSLWTLAYEVTCYAGLLAAHLLFRKFLKYALLILLLVTWGSFFYWHEYLLTYYTPIRIIHLSWINLLDFGLYFLMGSILFYFKDQIVYNKYILFILFLVFLLSYLLSAILKVTPLESIGWIRYVFLPYAVLFFGFQKGWLNNFGRSGDISYGLYIYSFPLQQLIVLFYGPEIISITEMFLYSLVLTLPIAWLSWHFVEAPSLQLKEILK